MSRYILHRRSILLAFMSVLLLSAVFSPIISASPKISRIEVQEIHDVAVINVDRGTFVWSTWLGPSMRVRDFTYTSWQKPFDINVTVENEGDFVETFNVTAYNNTSPIGTQTVTDLAPGENVTLNFIWDHRSVAASPRVPAPVFVIAANASVVPSETDTIDNTYVDGTVQVRHPGDSNGDGRVDENDFPPQYMGDYDQNPRWDFDGNGVVGLPDIVILAKNWGWGAGDIVVTNVTLSATEVYPTWTKPLHINITVKNEGDFTETFTVKAYYSSVTVGTQNVINLTVGASTTLTFTFAIPLLPGYPDNAPAAWPYPNYIIKAEAMLLDIHPDDNILINGSVVVKWPGDIDGDGHINIQDLVPFAKAWNGHIVDNPSRYNPQADFDMNGEIDLRDLVKLAKNWYKGPLDP